MPSGPATIDPETQPPRIRDRSEIEERHKWDLSSMYPDWPAWERDLNDLSRQTEQYASLQGTLAGGPDKLLHALKLADDVGACSYKVWYYASLTHDQDQRDNTVNARRQQVQILFARWQEASSWFGPELLAIPLETVREWMNANVRSVALSICHRGFVSPAGARAGSAW